MKQVGVFALPTEGVLQRTGYPIAPERWAALRRIPHEAARAQSIAAELLLCWAVRQFKPQGVPVPPVRSLSPKGKPYFAQNPGFAFSLSHAGDWAVLAVCDAPVGVDIEAVGQDRPQVVARFFHPREQDAYFALPEDARTDAFYTLWVRKEAVVKALGDGMHRPFASFAVPLPPACTVHGLDQPAALFSLPFPGPYKLGGCVLSPGPVQARLQVLSLDQACSE